MIWFYSQNQKRSSDFFRNVMSCRIELCEKARKNDNKNGIWSGHALSSSYAILFFRDIYWISLINIVPVGRLNNPIFVDPERGIESTLGVFHLSTGYYLWIGSFLTLLLGEIALFVLKNKIGWLTIIYFVFFHKCNPCQKAVCSGGCLGVPPSGRAFRYKSSLCCGFSPAIPNVGERAFTILRLHFDTRGFGCSPKLPAPRPARKSSPAFVRQPTLFKVVFYNIFYQ